ncbi:uncharacterized protein LOC110036408 [Phalaenopsis equestris]|uniref:uncharacterized protein LOC110036408 n=1 Tax=Phalaenopsis equestris TaxID=78828 RepID=UPI0009E25FE8|nr:uncharacterized protein LOC110036408 [Phalaenopsis equestris]
MKWTPEFDPSKEPPVVPIWFKFPNLPIQYFHQNVLFSISRVLGCPLKIDAPTYNMARPARARVLVERDISLPDIDRVWIGTSEEGFWQQIVMEQKLGYFQYCKMFGNNVERCYRLHPASKRKTAGVRNSYRQVETNGMVVAAVETEVVVKNTIGVKPNNGSVEQEEAIGINRNLKGNIMHDDNLISINPIRVEDQRIDSLTDVLT